MDDVNVLRQAICAFINLILKLVKKDTLREAITISSICNKVFRTMFLKTDTSGIIPKLGYGMADRSPLKPFNGWRTLVEQETMLLMSVMGVSYIWLGYQI